MKKVSVISVLCMGLMLLSCGRQPAENRLGKQLYTLQELPHKIFALDDSTTQVLDYIHTFEEGDSLLLASYNKPMNNICIFDVKSGKEIRKLQFQKEGPNALGKNVFGFLYHNKDSIYVYHTWTWQLDLFNGKGEVLSKYHLLELPQQPKGKYVMPEILPQPYAPIKKVGNKIILQGQGGMLPKPNPDKLCQAVTAILNLDDNSVYCANEYPVIYGDVDNIWQVFSYRLPSYDLSPQDEMVISFPADDSIRVYNLQTKQTRSYFAGYSVPYEIRPARSGSMVDVTRSVYDQVQYSCIYYDRWHGLYYRILTLPVKEDYDINSRENLSRNLAVVILDKDFQKVGEYNVQEKSDRYAFMFVSPEGLHIQVLSDDDDYMTFMTLKPQKL